MEKLGLNQLREMFEKFYVSKGHYKRGSFSLIPEKDKSLLIINSGMAPLKAYFAGLETPPAKRMTTCQKCIRTGDIENVGYTSRHGTFFEMLGSFSFGDYFKVESLKWGWEFITEVLKMPTNNLWATVYEEDEEAYDIWKNIIGLKEDRIVKLGKDDNFWEIGTGPCGPCSEIYYDRGSEYGCGKEDCKPGCDCDRYVEFWNHVFTQFNRDDAGNYTPLANPNIDTGMGLERLACIMQGVDSIFDVDTIKFLLEEVVSKSGVEYMHGAAKTDVSIRIITDHIRSVTFMIGDGIIPSNEGRGYVLRRLLRRAARHGKILGIEGPFLAELSKKVIEISKSAYPELEEKKNYIHKILTVEEEKFSQTIDQGTSIINDYILDLEKTDVNILDGVKVFKLYDTFGFPLELTQEILEEHGCSADVEGFNINMQLQKETARAARKSEGEEGWADDDGNIVFEGKSDFSGYTKVVDSSKIIGIFHNKLPLSLLKEGDIGIVILNNTPFYAESGGQSSDKGYIYNDEFMAEVLDVIKLQKAIGHKVRIQKGELLLYAEVTASVSITNRNSTSRNHTATHLLHKALREVVGTHVNQAGSNVTANSLRFDFSHFEAIPKEKLNQIQEIVNDKILHFLPVLTEETSIQDASKNGATALFGEKYGDVVRVVSIADYSKELCGGTHVNNIGEIGAFKIVSESGVAAGVRRIEAITGTNILNRLIDEEDILNQASDILKSNVSGLVNKITSLNEDFKSVKKELEDMKLTVINSSKDEIINEAKVFNGVKLITKSFTDYSINDLRNISDKLKADNKALVIVFSTENEGKVTFMVSVTDDLFEKGYHAGNMIKQIAGAAGGGGGGKADMAQAGAKDPGKIMDAFKVAEGLMM
jgi:alanyl-tRNA synthetase